MPRTHISELVLFQEAMLLRPHLRMRVVSDGLDRAPVNFSAYTDHFSGAREGIVTETVTAKHAQEIVAHSSQRLCS